MNAGKSVRNIFLAGAVVFLLVFSWAGSAAAQGEDTWQFELTIYGWYAGVDGNLKYPVPPGSGGNISVDASDILSNLNMIFMGGFQAKKNKWSLLTDVIYLDLGDDTSRVVTVGPSPGIPVNASMDLDLKTWVLQGGIGYEVVQADRGELSVVGGVRYTGVDVDLQVGLQGPLPFPRPPAEASDTVDLLDGIVGVKGLIKLNENWYLPYYADIGTGDSDLTWQLFAGIGYQFGWGDVRLGYRYLKYELDDGKLLEDLELNGPLLGVGFRF